MPDPEVPTGEGTVGTATGSPLWRLRFVIGLGVLLVVAVAVGLALWLQPDPPAPPDTVRSDDEDLDQVLAVTNPGYVGIEACAECHAQRAATVKKSRHYLACRPASEGAAAPGFAPGRGLFATRVPGLHFEMTRTGNDFFETRIQADQVGQRISYKIGLVYGSAGKHDEIYFAWENDRLYHLPVAWLYPYDRWGQAAHVTAPIQTHSSCLECHNTWVGHVPGSFNQYRRDEMHLGVTCERCHGPGKEHTEYHRAHPNEASRGILHPGTLSRERLMDVCAQCHANAKRLGAAFSYRPGQPLETNFHDFKPTYQEDDTTNQVRYLRESKCFQNSKMTCITCHDPHRLKSAQSTCLDCHEPAKCTAQPRLPAAVRGDCVGCHMPQRVWTHAHLYTTTDDQYVPLAPRADHRIGVYPEAAEAVVLAWLRQQPDERSRAEAELLAAKITQHWVNEAAQRLSVWRFKGAMAAYREALRIAPNPAVRKKLQEAIARQSELDDMAQALRAVDRADAAIPILQKMLEVKPNSAIAHGELGNIYATMGKREEAVTHLRAVAKCDPNDPYGLTKLAWLAYLDGRTEEVAALCAQADKIDPTSQLNRHLWGQVLSKQGRWPDAEKQFRRVLASDPTHVGGNQGLSEALRNQGQAAEAVRFARRAAHWSKGQDAEVLLTLADAYVAANRNADARKTFEQALTVVGRTNPNLAQAIRERLQKLPQ